jgi:hypothetical protein
MYLFMARGWLKHQAAGMIGRAQQEAYLDIRTGVLGDDATAFGGFQWRKNRIVFLKAFAWARGMPDTDWPTQCEYAIYELLTTEHRSGELLRASTNVEEACASAMSFCRPNGWIWPQPPQTWDKILPAAKLGHGWNHTLSNAMELM